MLIFTQLPHYEEYRIQDSRPERERQAETWHTFAEREPTWILVLA